MSPALALTDFITAQSARPDGHARMIVNSGTWTALAEGCAAGLQDLVALWADDGVIYVALADAPHGLRAIVSIRTEGGRYPSFAARHAPALRLERAMRDLYGVEPVGLSDVRPWLDHGRWPGCTNRGTGE